jgi:deoxyadenosine/deoxycytidine kinase
MKLVIDGNIGCGKSSIMNKIINSNLISIPVYKEPLDDWNKWLDLFYSNMQKHSFGFQMKVLKSHLDNNKIPHGIFERSPLSCQRVFGELLYEDNLMSELEWELTEEYNRDFGWIPELVIYLKCDPNTCFKRIQQRNRTNEKPISLEYLTRLDAKYTKLYNGKNNENFGLIVIDATQSIDNIFEEIKEKLINYFINKYQVN